MLNARHKNTRSLTGRQATAPLGRPGARIINDVPGKTKPLDSNDMSSQIGMHEVRDDGIASTNFASRELHPLTRKEMNFHLFHYERNVKDSFDGIEVVLNEIKVLQGNSDFEHRAKALVREKLGIEMPSATATESWNDKPEMYLRNLYAWCLFEVYQRYCNSFTGAFPSATGVHEFQEFIQDCGFHTVDVTPCADGRLAHVISYVLRLPYRAVRRKSFAGAMFDVEDNVDKWVETELMRFREGVPNTSNEQTRYLKTVVYHFSSLFPDKEGCAAHGSNAERAAQAGKERLNSFKQAVENKYCCGASIDQLLIGLDTDTDVIRIHVPGEYGEVSVDRFIDANQIYNATKQMSKDNARTWIMDFVEGENPQMAEGLAKFISNLLINNISQIDYVQTYLGKHYEDIGHAERFIGIGKGFEEVQLRNLTFFSYLNTVEESAADLDVGVKIFTGLNVNKGIPIPVVVRFDYHGNVPGSRERAIEHCYRVNDALKNRYENLFSQGLLHTLMVIKDVNTVTPIEKLGSSIEKQAIQEAY